MRRRRFLVLALAMLLVTGARAQNKFIVVASTTSTEQSGLFSHLLPAFAKDTRINVRVVALGTGQALDVARRGDADVVFVHDQPAEERFVAEGFGLKRQPVMYNDFVIVGPKPDPAGLRGSDVAAAMKKLVATANVSFVSRGDRSAWRSAHRACMERSKPHSAELVP